MHHINENWAIIIPARYESSRFPGKPLVEICGVSLIERVWRQCVKGIRKDKVFVATDDKRIYTHVESFGGQVVETSRGCLTGTDRVYEAAKKLGLDNVINIQGDEPLINPDDIKLFVEKMLESPQKIFNGMTEILSEEEFRSSTVPKVVATPAGRLMYMSRAAIPTTKQFEFKKSFKQVCIYAFPMSALSEFVKDGVKTPVEEIEDIEILRFLEKGFDVGMIEVTKNSLAVDIPEDIEKVERALEV